MKPIICIDYKLLSGSWKNGYYIMYVKANTAPLHGLRRLIIRAMITTDIARR